jgi:quercetin dioxygenase-like cupin family protein
MELIAHNKGIEAERIESVQGQTLKDEVKAKLLLKGTQAMLLEFHLPKGTTSPEHVHPHDSYSYIVSGKIKTIIGEIEGILESGDAVLHPEGVMHTNEALEDTLMIVVKSPPSDFR